jgi:ribonuclease PH
LADTNESAKQGRIRGSGRSVDHIRPVTIETGVNIHAEGSVLITVGNTKVLCTASVEEKVPPFLKGSGKGWVTAEYSMLPRATTTRSIRESAKGKLGGRTVEIQRLIGRSLRAVVDHKGFGERAIWIDCDVIQADGGTRTTAITGGFVAMVQAFSKLKEKGVIDKIPVSDYLAAVSVGKLEDGIYLDLDYEEDYAAAVDMNVVMTGKGLFVELQGTAEDEPFEREELNKLIDFAYKGILELVEKQKEALGPIVLG